ncbi:hypothetical protein SEVIR_1G316275v4 [Setaria viridis]
MAPHAAGSVFNMALNSSKEMTPSPLRSNAATISAHRSAVTSSPNLRSARRSSSAVITPSPSSSYSANALRRSTDWSPPSNSAPSSSRLMKPSPSRSAAATISSASSAVQPQDSRISSAEMRPSPSASKRRNTLTSSGSGVVPSLGGWVVAAVVGGGGGGERPRPRMSPQEAVAETTRPIPAAA